MRMRLPLRIGLLLLALLVAPGFVHAVEPDEILADPALEARARALSTELRCLVCQNQSIDDSSAPLARDLRILVRERLKQGDSDAAVRDFVVQRYGTFVLLRPPVSMSTLLLWATPLLLLLSIVVVIARRLRAARMEPVAAVSQPLTADEQARLDRLLERR
jgi:cytochrome c-type biogenesis protein CcmH